MDSCGQSGFTLKDSSNSWKEILDEPSGPKIHFPVVSDSQVCRRIVSRRSIDRRDFASSQSNINR